MKRHIAVLAAVVSLSATAAFAAVQSPVGTQWDCILSGGGQQGIAFITFYDDGTFRGYELLSTRVRKSSVSDDLRGAYTDVGRGTQVSTNRPSGYTNLFGFGPISGPWGYDDRGKVVGHFVLEIGEDSEGNPQYTNAVSFRASVVPGKRLTLLASSRDGKITYSGVPFAGTPDLSGQWNGVKVSNKQSFVEFFDLTSVTVENPFGDEYADLGDYAGIYFTLYGQGAGYDMRGFTLVSTRKKIGFAFQSTPWGNTNSVLSASFGSWSSSKKGVRASTVGVEDPMTAITFKASKALTE